MRCGFGWVAGLVLVVGAACGPKAPMVGGKAPPLANSNAAPPANSGDVIAGATERDRATIAVTRSAIALDGQIVAESEPITLRRRLVRVEELFRALKERKRAIPAKRALSGQQLLTVSPDASPEASLSAMLTAAVAGYDQIHATTGSISFDAGYTIGTPKSGQHHSIVTVTKLGQDIDISWQTDASCSVAPRGARIQKGALSNWLRLTCSRLPKPCVDIVALSIGTDDTFEDVATIVRSFQSHSDKLRLSVSRWLRTPTQTTEGSECGHPVLYEDLVSPPSFVREAVRQSSDTLRACYQKGLERDRGIEGIVSIRFTIGKDGKVSNVESVQSIDELADTVWPAGELAITTISDREVVACIAAEYQRLSFPALAGRALKVVYPMKFSYEQKK